MKKITILFLATFALVANEAISQDADQDKKPAIVFSENDGGGVNSGKVYRSSVSGAARGDNGVNNGAFANQGDWSVDLVISQFSPYDAAVTFGSFIEDGHPIYTGGDGNWSTLSEGMGAIGWGSFAANTYNRAAGLGGVALGFNTLSGTQVGASGGPENGGGNIGQFSAGYASRAIGNISTATGFRNTASGSSSVSMGYYNYATGDATIALGKENWAEGASTVAIGFKNHAGGPGTVALGQENIAYGSTGFTSGYQNVTGNASDGTGGSATAMGKYNTASADASMALNRGTSATNQTATSMGFRTISDNVGMLAIGVNNEAGIGDPTADQYYYVNGEGTGAPIGVAFVIGNGDIKVDALGNETERGDNPSNAFVVKYDGSATLSGDLTINSDARLKSNIVTLGSTLSRLLLIDGKSYTMKANESISKIGLLAQEVQSVFPELVKKANNSEETLSVNYQGMIPVLLNAIKEQQAQIDELKALIKK